MFPWWRRRTLAPPPTCEDARRAHGHGIGECCQMCHEDYGPPRQQDGWRVCCNVRTDLVELGAIH